jgi:hypothetical protein
VEGWLRDMGVSEHDAHDMVARAVDRIDAGFPIGGPYNHIRSWSSIASIDQALARRLTS